MVISGFGVLLALPELQLREGAFYYLCQGVSGLITEAASKDQKQIDKPANAKHANGKEPKDTCAGFAYIETVRTEITQKQAKEKGGPFTLMCIRNSGTITIIAVSVGIGVCIYNVNDRLLLRYLIRGSLIGNRLILDRLLLC